MDFGQIMQTLNSENGLQNMMLQPAFEDDATGHEFSQADLIADVVNIMRMDTKQIAEAHGVDVSIKRMTPERAAALLQGVAKGEDLGLIDIFDKIEDQRMTILAEIEDEEAVEEYVEMKRTMLHSVPDPSEMPSPDEIETQAAEEVAADEN